MQDTTHYLKFYDAERYLLEDVGTHFREVGTLDPADFYMLFIWKANRAKNNHRDRLKRKAGTFQEAVSQIASALYTTSQQRERLRILMMDWGFKLPTATAILAILYPVEFTVYDERVCKELGIPCRPDQSHSDVLWADYEKFRQSVIDATPPIFPCGIKIVFFGLAHFARL